MSAIRGIYDVQDYGAKGDGATNDLAALQAAVDAADAAGGGTVWLGPGTYNIGTGTWKIGQAAAQHHVNIEGINPIATRIVCNTSGGNAAIYFNLQKYVYAKNFSVINEGARGGYGIQFGGDLGAGMQSNGINCELVCVQNFNFGMYTSGGIGTSSDILFNHCIFMGCEYGWYTANFNALDYLLIMPEFWSCDTGCFVSTGNVQVIHGCGEFNKTDFNIPGGYDATVRITGFRSENDGSQPSLIALSGSPLTIEDYIVHSTTKGTQTMKIMSECRMHNCQFDGYITWLAGGPGKLLLDGVSVNTPGTDWSIANQSSKSTYPNGAPFGPGFRFSNNQGPMPNTTITVRDVYEASNGTYYPNVDCAVTARSTDNIRIASVRNILLP